MEKAKKILALVTIIVLLGSYLLCLIFAVTDPGRASTAFKAALGLTIALPVVLYGCLLLAKVLGPKPGELVPEKTPETEEEPEDGAEEPKA